VSDVKMAPRLSTGEADELDAVGLTPLQSSDGLRLKQGIDTEQYNDAERPFMSRSDGDDDVDAALLDEDEEAATKKPRRGRSNTLSGVSFDFSRNLLPLSLSEDQEIDGAEEKSLGLINGLSIPQHRFHPTF
jgi:hypothetical protein